MGPMQREERKRILRAEAIALEALHRCITPKYNAEGVIEEFNILSLTTAEVSYTVQVVAETHLVKYKCRSCRFYGGWPCKHMHLVCRLYPDLQILGGPCNSRMTWNYLWLLLMSLHDRPTTSQWFRRRLPKPEEW